MNRDLRIWTAGLAGPIAWTLLLVVGFAVVPEAHIKGHQLALHLMQLAAFVITAIAGVVALREVRRLHAIESDDPIMQRARFVAHSAVALAAISLLLVIGLAIPTFMLIPGAEP